MNLKTKKKIFFFIFIFYFFFSNCLIIDHSAAQENDDYYSGVIQPSWLYLNVEDSDLNDKLKFTQGGVSLTDFENLGIYERNPNTNEVIFSAKAIFTCQMQVYTTATAYTIYSDMDTNHYEGYMFLDIIYRFLSVQKSRQVYSTTFTSIDLGDEFNPSYFNEQVSINIGLNPAFDSLAGTQIHGTTISDSKYAWEVQRVKVNDVIMDSVGDYDIDITLPEDTSVEITAVTQEDKVSNNYAFRQATNNNLGCTITDTIDTQIQAELKDTTPIGNSWSNINSGVFTFHDWIELQPKVSLLQNEVTTRYMRLGINDVIISTDYKVEKGLTTRVSPMKGYNHITSAVIVDNWFIWKTYEVEINILATTELTAHEYSESLGNPIFTQGDWIWDIHQGGTTELELVEQPGLLEGFFNAIFGALFGWIGAIIGIIFTIIIAYFIIKIIGSRRRK